MKEKTNCRFSLLRRPLVTAALILFILIGSQAPCLAQQIVGAITGTVLDSSGAAVGGAVVKAHNVATNLEVTVHSESNGSYSISNLPVGTYELSFAKEGFETETHTQVLVQTDRTATVDGNLKVGAVSTTVEVTAVPLMNQTDTTNGYVVDQLTIQSTPLGTGSFTQLAILSPGVHADFLGGAGSNSGLGNQAIFANGNRDTSNSFSLNGVSTNNLFNGNSTSQVGENRFVLNTGENFGSGGEIQTSTSVYGAIGQALPTPPLDAIQEISVNAAMYDASQGTNSGAHISVLTKSGTNQMHGSAWEQWQNSDMNAAPFFYNASPAITTKVPFGNRNQFGATLGGPLKKDKMFYFLSYQGIRVADASDATKDANVPLTLTDDRSAGGIVNMISSSYGKTITASQINPVALNLLQATLPNGQYLIPSAQITNKATADALGYDAVVQGPNAKAPVNQGIANLDYEVSERDRLSGKFYVQDNPTTNPFGAVGSLLGFAQQLSAGSQVGSIMNTITLSPTVTWEQHAGFTRLRAYSQTGQEITPSDIGINLLGATSFPQLEISSPLSGSSYALEFGPSTSFANAGMFQNQWEYESSLNLVKGRHTIAVGGQLDHTQLNIINNNTNTDFLDFSSFTNFVLGKVRSGEAFAGSANRYYRSNTVGAYVNDNFKLRSNLTVTAGLRWDYDGPLSEKYGKLTAFDPALYSYNVGADTISGSGLEIAGNNPTTATAGASNSLMNARQWGFAPRLGIAWAPVSKLTVRAGYGIYYDRGELFSYFSPSAGSGFNGPFGVTLAPPFVEPVAASTATGALSAPFGTSTAPPPTPSAASFIAYLPNLSQTASGHFPKGNLFGPFLFGGYDINNTLPYTQNWTLDLQYQLSNNWLFEIAYVGNHGTHEVLPVTFNEPQIATPQNPLWSQNPANEQIYSYGGTTTYSSCNNGGLTTETICPPPYYSGNTVVRVPYIGYDMNSVMYEAEGISNYHALQAQVHKRTSKGLQFTASYTYSHALDEQSGLGLFVTGNDPLTPRANYASADFDQTHVFLINYSYTFPKLIQSKGLGYLANGWTIGGQTVAQSGQPYSVYDYSGSVASLYYGTYDEIGNPIVPLAPGIKASQAKLQGTAGINAGLPVLNAADFSPQFLQPGQDGVPPCEGTTCDDYESLYGTTGRNMFRGPFQVRFDMSLAKDFPKIKERYQLRFEADAFNIFNHPDFDTPNNDVDFFPYYEGPPQIPPFGSLGMIQHTIGSPRFLQLSLHLVF
jgi:hypothetical protein